MPWTGVLCISCSGKRAGIFSLAGIFGEHFDDLFPTCAFFFKCSFKKKKKKKQWRSARAHHFHFVLGQGQSTVAQRTETTVAEYSLTFWVHILLINFTLYRQRQFLSTLTFFTSFFLFSSPLFFSWQINSTGFAAWSLIISVLRKHH